MRAALFLTCLALAACDQAPDLGIDVSPALAGADYPALVPLDPLLATRTPVNDTTDATTRSLQARVAALQSRARTLRARSVVDPATRARLRNGLR